MMNNERIEQLVAEWNKIRPRHDELLAEWVVACRQGIEYFTVWFNGNKAKGLELGTLMGKRSLIKNELKELSFDLDVLD